MSDMKKLFFIVFILFSFSQFTYADTTTIVCDYKTFSDNEGLHEVGNKFELTFIIDKDNGKAYMVGNLGTTEVKWVNSGEGISFIEITGSGNVMITAIDAKSNSGPEVAPIIDTVDQHL